jgi:hypothetical protein
MGSWETITGPVSTNVAENMMNRRTFVGMAGASIALLRAPFARASSALVRSPTIRADEAWTPAPVEFSSPFNVADKTQLFVDQAIVRDTKRVSFTLHPATKHPANPLIKVDQPWESWRVLLYGSVLYDDDEKLFKMWYQTADSPEFPSGALETTTGTAALYAISTDGIHWQKPLVGTIQAKTAKLHNAVLGNCDLPSVIKDNSDPDPSRRYKMICWIHSDYRGYRTFTSPDGLHWTPLSKTPICRGADVITGYYDQTRGLYVAYPKIMTMVRGQNRRVFYLITSKDFENWSEPELVWTPDLRDDAGSLARIERIRSVLDVPDNSALMRTEFYGIGAYQHESCTLAFPWVFTINNNARYGNQEGPFELQLGVSRDLKNWERPFRVPCLPYGDIGEWDCGLPETPAQAIRVGDEIWLYYASSNYTHGTPVIYRSEGTGRGTKYTASIGLAKWKLDRFVSADGPGEGGTLTTVPIVFSGNELEINAFVRAGGHITVRPLTADGQPLTGYRASLPFHGDSVRGKIAWPEGTSIASLKGKPVSLEFEIKDADLYSFAFKG